jgi:hypothetical protein
MSQAQCYSVVILSDSAAASIKQLKMSRAAVRAPDPLGGELGTPGERSMHSASRRTQRIHHDPHHVQAHTYPTRHPSGHSCGHF